MAPFEFISQRLTEGMHKGNMHACLRDMGRLAGGYAADGALSAGDVSRLEHVAVGLSNNKADGLDKWQKAVEYGHGQPVEQRVVPNGPDRAFSWDDEIGKDTDYQVIDPNWIEPVHTTEPDKWEPHRQIIDYLTVLFSAEEHVGYVTETWSKDGRHLPTKGHWDRTAGQLIEELTKCNGDVGAVFGDYNTDAGVWIRFNPLDGEGVRDANVVDFRFALVESDEMDIDQQRGVYEQLELPIAAMVHSGNKSLHAIVRIDAADKTEYKKRVDLLYEICKKNGLEVDQQNRNPSRLSRMPGIDRGSNRQFLVATNVGKSSWAEWEDWIEAVNDDLPDPEPLDGVWDNLPALSPPLIDGVLRQGHKMLLAGPSKAGKSYLLIQLCIAIAEGREWLCWPCTQGRILYVNLELDRASCLHRFRNVYEALGQRPINIGNIDIWNLRGRAVPMDRLAPKLIRRAAKKGYVAVVIDPIYKVITGDENSADKMAHFCNQFDLVCHELQAAVIYCHHHSKGVQGGKRSMDRASGSGVFARDPDAMMDLIELDVSDHLRAQQGNSAICDLISGALDGMVPDWRDHPSDDDLLSEVQMRALATRLLGDRYRTDLLPQIYAMRESVARRTAWRVEGTLREFARQDPVDCWFSYPIHTADCEGVLQDATSKDEQPMWKKTGGNGDKGGVSGVAKRKLSLANAIGVLAGGDGSASLAEVAEYVDKSPRTVREWAKEAGGYVVESNTIRRAS